MIIPSLLLTLTACDTCPEAAPTTTGSDTSGAVDSGDTGNPAADELLQAEVDALGSWTARTVEILLEGSERTLEGDEIRVLLPDAKLADFDVVTALTRAQDHNSSRSNKTASIWVSDDFGDGDTGVDADGLLSMRWDGGAACARLPCPGAGRPEGASSRLTLNAGSALSDGLLSMTWGETTAMEEEFSGYLGLGARVAGCGHVTVLKAAETGEGGLAITSALDAAYLGVFLDDAPLFEGKPSGAMLATITGSTGASWPNGVSIEETAKGTYVSFTW